MNEQNIQNNEEIEIDLGRLLRAVMDRAWVVMVVTVLCAVLAFAGTFFFITPQYEAAAKFYVNNNALSVGDTSFSISSGDLTTSRNLVDSYIVILNTRETLNDVIDYAGVERTYKEITEMIEAAAVNETEIFQVSVTSPDPQEAEKIANAIAYILPKRIGTIIDGTSAKVVEAAVVPSSPSSPSFVNNTAIGFLLGFVLAVGVIALREIFDITVRTEEDIAQCCSHPILASVPDMTAHGKGSSYYGYGSTKHADNKKKAGAYAAAKPSPKQPALMGDRISFAASEAYKLLRTKLQFSFSDENSSHVIGISSSLSSEGKSLTAVNLAYTLSQLNKRVVLVDCDMRRPTLADKLHIRKSPGLSSLLTGQSNLADILQSCDFGEDELFYVIAAGQNPPNPIELLSSGRMRKMLAVLRKEFDYIIIDLPPVGEVSDALAVAKQTDGMLLVVRQNYCDRVALSETVHQFSFIDARMLGVIFNCTGEHDGKYGKGYKRYYKRYGRNSAYDYEHNDRSVSKASGQKNVT